MNDKQSPVFRSRFGFHPCDAATFHKLKELHGWYWQTAREFHRWWRWQRKLPANRRGSEPKPCVRFLRDEKWRKPRRSHGQETIRTYPLTLTDRGLLAWYAAARLPRQRPMPPFAPCTLAAIDSLHREVSIWMSVVGQRP